MRGCSSGACIYPTADVGSSTMAAALLHSLLVIQCFYSGAEYIFVREAAVMKTDRQKITMAGWWAYMTRKERQSGDRKRGWAVCEQKGEGE